jgi:protein-disulfide isomerase
MSASMQSVNDVIGAAAAGRAPNRQAGRTGPDPEKVYEVDTASSPAKGPEDAAVTLVAFSDFQCPFCARVTPTLAQVDEEYGSEVRIVFKHLPLSMHPKAPAAHAAAEAARLQGKFWEMHDLIFANQREMSEEKYVEYAGEIGLDVERFRRDVASPAVIAAVERDKQEAEALGVTGTPSFFVNGKFMSGAQPLSEFKARIEAELEG